MKALYLIPARGGSKGIPKKNIKLFSGKPLIYYTIDAARGMAEDDDICVSTDSQEIINTVEQYNLLVPFIRPAEISTDTATSEAVILHALDFYRKQGKEYDLVILLQPTSPLRTSQHIKQALELYDNSLDMVVSVFETKSNPYYVLYEEYTNGLLQKSKQAAFPRRQDCPKVYEVNGAIYIINVQSLLNKGRRNFIFIKKYEMERSLSIDIDDDLDWFIGEQLYQRLN